VGALNEMVSNGWHSHYFGIKIRFFFFDGIFHLKNQTFLPYSNHSNDDTYSNQTIFFLLNQPPPHKQFSYNAAFFQVCSQISLSNEKNESPPNFN
jgi:hypothetical protein